MMMTQMHGKPVMYTQAPPTVSQSLQNSGLQLLSVPSLHSPIFWPVIACSALAAGTIVISETNADIRTNVVTFMFSRRGLSPSSCNATNHVENCGHLISHSVNAYKLDPEPNRGIIEHGSVLRWIQLENRCGDVAHAVCAG